MLNGQDVPVSLNRAIAPCGVNSFLSLASQGFYDDTTCHRLTNSEQLNILQCGDPTGQGNGGPGYSFATEVAGDATYPVGTVALANAGPDTNGSQFFIVYGTTTARPSVHDPRHRDRRRHERSSTGSPPRGCRRTRRTARRSPPRPSTR